MSTIPALITEARRIVERHGMTQSTILIDRLADALEAEHKRASELEAVVNDGGNQAAKYWTRLTTAEADANRRLRNLEEAVAERDEARAERDRYRAAIERLDTELREDARSSVLVVIAQSIVDGALNDKEAEK